MESAAIAGLVRERFPAVETRLTDNKQDQLLVPGAAIADVATLARGHVDLRCDALMSLSGLDRLKWPGAKKGEFPFSDLVLTYHLYSYVHRHRLTLVVSLPRDLPEAPTVSGVWPAALQFERECWDLYGIRFTGHPDLRRIMLPDDWVGHPLRKDYAYPESYGGAALMREGQHFDDGPYAAPAIPKPAKPGAA